MKIDFDRDINGFQQARRLRMILEQSLHAVPEDPATRLMLESLLQELSDFLSRPEFEAFHRNDTLIAGMAGTGPADQGLLSRLWRTLFGPSRREMLLSSQRQELIERAERAESIAFESLAETAQVAKERDRIRQELEKLRGAGDASG